MCIRDGGERVELPGFLPHALKALRQGGLFGRGRVHAEHGFAHDRPWPRRATARPARRAGHQPGTTPAFAKLLSARVGRKNGGR